MRAIAEILKECYEKKFGTQKYKNSVFKSTYGAVAALAMDVYAIESRIQERRDIIYVIEMDLMDNEEEYPEQYKQALKDEIDNHNNFIADWQKHLNEILENT